MLFAPKKDGSDRLCVDYRKTNDITIKNRYPIPSAKELQDRIQGATIFTAIDLRWAYHLIRMKEGEEWKTAFRTRYGHYEYQVMPFGLTNAPASCQALINNTLRKMLDISVIAYLDDILIFSKTKEEHVKHVKEVLTALAEKNLRVNPKKCEWHKEEVEFLGFRVGKNGIRMSPDKVKAIREWPRPTTVKHVQGFLGFANYNRQFIEGYSKKATPLTNLTKKEQKFHWGKDQERAFQEIKEACAKEPVLKVVDPKRPVQLETDASDEAIGACLTQEYDGKRHPCAYYSRKMSGAETRYDIHDKELLAIVEAVKHWRHYCESSMALDIYTDHKNLVYFTTTKVLNRRQVRWAEMLGEYKFTIHYTPGKDNGRADALSRRPDLMEKEQEAHSLLELHPDGRITGRTCQLNATFIMEQDNSEVQYVDGKRQVKDQDVEQCIREHHDGPEYGHPGVHNTVSILKRSCHFARMQERVSQYIKKCVHCQRNKHSTHAKYGRTQPIPLPEEPWQEITMDFITKLPKSVEPTTKTKYDSIMVVVDRLTKYAHLIPFKETFDAEQLGRLFVDRVVRYQGFPDKVISDRDKLFTSAYWRTLLANIGTKLKLSTAYHPETDGQTERTNQTLEQYLRHYVTVTQDNWVDLLPMAQLAMNNRLSDSTGESPYYANHGKHARQREALPVERPSESAKQRADRLKETHEMMRQKDARKKEGIRRRDKKKDGPQLKEGDKVYLLTDNLRTKRPSKKLDHRKVGPFLIKAVKKPRDTRQPARSYELDLPRDARIHPVFDIRLLEPAHPDTPLQVVFHYEADQEREYEVETIVDKNHQGRYLVKWRGYPDSENTWEPLSNLQNCQQKVEEFQKRKRAKHLHPSHH